MIIELKFAARSDGLTVVMTASTLSFIVDDGRTRSLTPVAASVLRDHDHFVFFGRLFHQYDCDADENQN